MYHQVAVYCCGDGPFREILTLLRRSCWRVKRSLFQDIVRCSQSFMSSLLEEPLDEAIKADEEETEVPAQLDETEEENQITEEGEIEAAEIEADEGALAEEDEQTEVSAEASMGEAARENGDVSPWGEDETNQEVEAGAEDDGDDDDDDGDDAWEWQLRVVQRVSEGMLDLSLFTSGGFDFVVVLNVQQNALRDLEPIAGMARTLRVLNATQNEIATLPGLDFWTKFRCLSLCFLAQNALRTWTDVLGLEGCAGSLTWLTLANNPS